MVKSLTLVGNGKMALALAKGLCGIYALEVVGRSSDALEQFEKALGRPVQKTLYADALIEEKTVILCVKPANLAEIAPYLKGTARTVYSVLAGTPLAALSAICARNYCRAMPNLAAEVALSMTSLVGDPETQDEALALFGTIGSALWLSSEKELDIATALAGSGPAYLALIAEALADGAVREGLRRDDAATLVKGLFSGFAGLLQTTHPAILKDGVMSPGGTTAAGYGALESGGVRNGCMEAVRAAHEKAKALK